MGTYRYVFKNQVRGKRIKGKEKKNKYYCKLYSFSSAACNLFYNKDVVW